MMWLYSGMKNRGTLCSWVEQSLEKNRKNSLKPDPGERKGRGQTTPRPLAGMLVTLTEGRG